MSKPLGQDGFLLSSVATSSYIDFTMEGQAHYVKVTRSVNLGLSIAGAVLNIIALVAIKFAQTNTKLPKYLFLIRLNISDILISVSSAVAGVLILSDVHWCSITDHMHIFLHSLATQLWKAAWSV